MPKVIAAVTNNLLQDQRMIRTCTSLQKHGFEVNLVGRTNRYSHKVTLSVNYRQTLLPIYFNRGPLFYLEYNLRLFFMLMTQPFDLVCAVDLDTLPACRLAAKLKQKKCLLDAHEYFTEVPELIDRPLIKAVWEAIGGIFVPGTDACYTVGPALAAELSRKYNTSFSVVRNVPSSKQQVAGKRHENFIILYQGMLNKGRGLEQLIEVMHELPGAELWIAGRGDLEEQLKIQASDLRQMGKVVFKGFIMPEELHQLTLTCDIGVNLLNADSASYRYSLANKAFDYVQAGKPSIQMNFPEYASLNKAYQIFLCVDSLDPTELSRAIRQLMENKTLYQTLADNCRQAAKQLCWEQEEQMLIDIYQKTLNR
jgi:glycosyltransferase involved in cell wall biosynthesis